jgi:hypothetical protein
MTPEEYCPNCDTLMCYRGIKGELLLWECNECEAQVVRCGYCYHLCEYHQWPCLDPVSGNHLGDHKVWTCTHCPCMVDVS